MSRWREFKAWLLQESKVLSEVLGKEASEADAKEFKIRQEKLQVSFGKLCPRKDQRHKDQDLLEGF